MCFRCVSAFPLNSVRPRFYSRLPHRPSSHLKSEHGKFEFLTTLCLSSADQQIHDHRHSRVCTLFALCSPTSSLQSPKHSPYVCRLQIGRSTTTTIQGSRPPGRQAAVLGVALCCGGSLLERGASASGSCGAVQAVSTSVIFQCSLLYNVHSYINSESESKPR